MTIREYAKSVDFEIVGKLTRRVRKTERFDWCKGEYIVQSTTYWVDEAGNEYGSGYIVTADGATI